MSDTFSNLDTARLRIRPFRPAADAKAMAAVYCDPEVMRFIPGGPLDADAVEGVLAIHVRENDARDLGFYAIDELASGVLVGEVGFSRFEGELELGWTLARAYWGRGYATEAATACLRRAPLVAVIDADNAASIHVAEKIGLSLREDLVLHGRRHLVFAHPGSVGA